jgi:hypothetical protein
MMYTSLSNHNNRCNKKTNKRNNMDKVCPEILLKFISPEQYHRFTLVKFYIKAGLALTSQPNINAVIGPYGVNIINLQKKLEPIIDLFEKGTIIPIVLKVYDFDKYQLIVKFPTTRFFITQLERSNFISIYQLYELVKKKKKQFDLIKIDDQSIFESILGYLRASQISVYHKKGTSSVNKINKSI